MISAHLPPGTKIVCVAHEPFESRAPLEVGRVYVLVRYGVALNDDIIVHVSGLDDQTRPAPWWKFWEINRYRYGYRREDFDLLQETKQSLPTSILECLNARPVDKREVVEG